MGQQKQLCIGLSLAVTWLMGNGWRRPDSRVEDIYDIGFYAGLARRAEAACLDFLFRPDALFLDRQALRHSPGFSSLDPTVLVAALAGATRRIGLVTTAATTFNPPYVVARQLQSLNWVTQGRVGWNVVTALDGNLNFGAAAMPSSAERYRKALEFVQVVRELWRSYPHAALRCERESGAYADASCVRPIDHDGEFFSVQGPLNLPAPAYGMMPLFQAGASPWGRDFAACIADAVFAATPDIEAGQELRRDLRARASAYGRQPDAIRVLPGISLFLASCEREARDLYAETHVEQDMARRYARVQQLLGVDLAELDPNAPLALDMLPTDHGASGQGQTHAALMRRLIERETPSIRDFMQRPEVAGSAHWQVVGTPAQAVAAISERFRAGAADGFIALPGGAWQSLELFLDEVVPGLAQAGLFRKAYAGSTLREHLGMKEA